VTADKIIPHNNPDILTRHKTEESKNLQLQCRYSSLPCWDMWYLTNVP